MKRKQVIAFVSAAALAVTSLAGCGKTEENLDDSFGFLSLMHVNNEVGSIIDIENIAREVKKLYPTVKISGNSNCPSWRLYESKCEA